MTKMKKQIYFPKRFEMEGIDPLTVKVKVVNLFGEVGREEKIFNSLAEVPEALIFGCVGPMADKLDNQWCLRFETRETYKHLSK